MKNKPRKNQQIHMLKFCTQPRSPGPRRRTDFSDFLSSSCRGSIFDFSNCKDSSSSITTASMDQSRHALIRKEEMTKLSLARCIMSQSGGNQEFCFKSKKVPFTEVESVAQNVSLGICENGIAGEPKNDCISNQSTTGSLPSTPNKSKFEVAMSRGSWIAPGSVVWAKTDCHIWWPAEVMDEREALSSTSNQSVDGLVLVQFYGNHKCAWVDPVGDLSQFDDCFEERSCNPMNSFQDALKQAIHRKEQLNLCNHGKSTDDLQSPIPHDQSSDKCNASSSSRTEDDNREGGRGKRKRKPKVHFDEVTFPEKSTKKARRLRIMRYLGLTAPVGSPFPITSPVQTAYKSYRVFDV